MTFNIQWKGSPNFWQGRNGAQPVAIVDHIMQGTMESTTGWFANPTSQVSAHFGVAKDGRIYQYVKLSDAAWANGPVNQPDPAIGWISDGLKKDPQNFNPNWITVSIEHEGNSGDVMPEIQYQATLWLHEFILGTFPIPVDRQHIIGHYQINRVDRPNCPGPSFPWQRLINDLQAWQLDQIKEETTGTTDVNPHSNFTPNPNNYSVGSGVLTEMDARGDVVATDEQFYSPSGNRPGLAQRSFTWAENGHLYIGFQQLNPDGTPSQNWEVQVWQKLP